VIGRYELITPRTKAPTIVSGADVKRMPGGDTDSAISSPSIPDSEAKACGSDGGNYQDQTRNDFEDIQPKPGPRLQEFLPGAAGHGPDERPMARGGDGAQDERDNRNGRNPTAAQRIRACMDLYGTHRSAMSAAFEMGMIDSTIARGVRMPDPEFLGTLPLSSSRLLTAQLSGQML
jgi:hypothetical protein